MADYFEESTKTKEYKEVPQDKAAKEISNWLLGEVSRIMNSNNIDIPEFRKRVSPERLVRLSVLESEAAINTATAKAVLEEVFTTGKDPDRIIAEQGLGQISDTQEIEETVSQVIASNPRALADFKAGKEQALKFLVGQVMKATRGRANPQLVNELLKKKLQAE
jgi:aspartyl-tRNA(Asn)/glutamyl-tRNA(Gln) amidotransferase subunit B